MCLDEQQSIIDDFDMISSWWLTTISIVKFNGWNYMQWLGEMAHLLEQKQVYGIGTGVNEWPADPADDAATAEYATAVGKLALRVAVRDWLKQHGTARSMILLGTELPLQASYMKITDARTLWEKPMMVYKATLEFNVFQMREELLGIRLEDCDDVDTYAVRIDRKFMDYTLWSEPFTSSSDTTRTLRKLTKQEDVF